MTFNFRIAIGYGLVHIGPLLLNNEFISSVPSSNLSKIVAINSSAFVLKISFSVVASAATAAATATAATAAAASASASVTSFVDPFSFAVKVFSFEACDNRKINAPACCVSCVHL